MDVMKDIISSRQKTLVGVLGVGKGAGTTFIAMTIAKLMGQQGISTAFLEERISLESNKVMPYDILSTDKKFKKKKLWNIYKLRKEGESIENKVNLYKNVNWLIRFPPIDDEREKNEEIEIDYTEINNDYIIIDTPKNPSNMDVLIVVIDPLPSRISAASFMFHGIKEVEESTWVKIVWLLNKENKYCDKRNIERFFEIKFDYIQPLINEDSFYESENHLMEIVETFDTEYLRKLIEERILK